MARMTLDTTDNTRARARTALIGATRAYDRALQTVENARLAQHARIVDARLGGVRQVDITGLTQTSRRPRGFTREHIRRIEKAHRRGLVRAREAGLNIKSLSTEDVLRLARPDDEDDRPVADIDDLADTEEADTEEADDEENEDVPAGVLA